MNKIFITTFFTTLMLFLNQNAMENTTTIQEFYAAVSLVFLKNGKTVTNKIEDEKIKATLLSTKPSMPRIFTIKLSNEPNSGKLTVVRTNTFIDNIMNKQCEFERFVINKNYDIIHSSENTETNTGIKRKLAEVQNATSSITTKKRRVES